MLTVLKHLATTLGRGLDTGRTESQDYMGSQGVCTEKPTLYGSPRQACGHTALTGMPASL